MEAASLPEVYSPGASVAVRDHRDEGLDENDILIPRMKIGQKMSREVLEYGGVYVLASRDDMDPWQLAAPPKGNELGAPVNFYVLGPVDGGPRKGWSWSPAVEGGDWRSMEYPDLNLVKDRDPRLVRRTYDYLVTLPEYPALPVMFIMHGMWGGQGAKAINTQLLLARQKGIEPHTLTFKLQARKTSNPKGGQERPFVQAVVGLENISAKDKAVHLELVEGHRSLIGSAESVRTVEDEGQGSAVPTPSASAPSLD